MQEYSIKFKKHISNSNFYKLTPQTQEFIETKAREYRLSFQNIKSLIDMATDLVMWQEPTIMDLWKDKGSKKETINHLKNLYKEIKKKPKSYDGFNSSSGNKKYRLIETQKNPIESIKIVKLSWL